MNRPQTQEYPEWLNNYIGKVDGDPLQLLEEQVNDFANFISGLEDQADHAYAPGKWTIKELLGHIIDCERIFFYRLLCFARGEKADLPAFEENEYVANARFAERSLSSLTKEFVMTRRSHLYLLRFLNETELDRVGSMNGKNVTVRALVYVLAGHVIHHAAIIKERYL